jgi:hypothetical protein
MTSQPTWSRSAIRVVMTECTTGRCGSCPGGICQHHCHATPANPMHAIREALELAEQLVVADGERLAAAARLVRDWRTEAEVAERNNGTRGHITAEALRGCAAELQEVLTEQEGPAQ